MPRASRQYLAHHLRIYLLCALAVSVASSLVYLAFPAYRSLLLDEDRVLETLSALLGLSVFVYALLLGIRALRYKKTGLAWVAFLAVVGLWSFLEEVSYGQRIFGFGSPRILGVPIDGLHDLAYVGKRYLEILIKYQARRLLALVVIVGFVAVVLAIRYRAKIQSFLGALLTTPKHLLFVIYVLLMLPPALLDLDIANSAISVFVEEVLELNAPLALLFSCMASDERAGERASRHIESAGPYARGAGE